MKFLANNRSHFSIGESLLTPEEIIQAAAQTGATSACLTDDMRISGMPEFFTAAKKAGIKPVIGARLRVIDRLIENKDDRRAVRPYYLRCIVRNEAGYKALLKLLSRSFDSQHFFMVPHVLLSDIAEIMGAAGADASLMTLGDFYGAIPTGHLNVVLGALQGAGLAVVSEVLPIPTPHFAQLARDVFELQETRNVPVILARPSFYLDAAHADALDVMRSISVNMKLDEKSTRHVFREFIPGRSYAPDLKALFELLARIEPGVPAIDWAKRIKRAAEYTETIPETVTFQWDAAAPSLPNMAPDEFDALKNACMAGWKMRFAKPVFGYVPLDPKPYAERLAYELRVIKNLKFSAYFLLVAEIVNWSKTNGIRVGPGRGSVGGSLVAYLMGITDVDPIRFNLLFERFINPERIDLPDADLDFASERREEVVDYLRSRFGTDYVAGVCNYTTLGAAGALNDVCRTVGLDTDLVFSRHVPNVHGVSTSLEEAITSVPTLEVFARDNPAIISHARAVEDRMRSYGTHAAGVVVGGVPLSERAVVETREGSAVINWDKSLAEKFGLVKIDVLGLATLDMLDVTVRAIFRNHGVKVDLTSLPLDDEDTLDLFTRGETIGIFQMDAFGARSMLRDMGAGSQVTFNDIVALNALNRPGPLDAGFHTSYIKRRNGEESVSYPHPKLEAPLNETYGVMVYQEQTMQISRNLSGFTGSEADTLRSAIGKKNKVLMTTMKEKFIDGAIKGTVTVEMEDGSSFAAHRNMKFSVKENSQKWTLEQIESNSFTLIK